MLHKLRDRAAREKGFTLIELLVVILIIGILAAIALPAFLNQRSKAQDTEAKSAARTAQTAMETYYTDEQTYDGATGRHGGCGEGHRARSRRRCRQSRPGDHGRPARQLRDRRSRRPRPARCSDHQGHHRRRVPHLRHEGAKGCPTSGSGSTSLGGILTRRIHARRARA